MKKHLGHILILIFILHFGCRENISENLDKEKTNELLTQIINDSTDHFLDSSCISEKTKFLYTIITPDFDNFIKTELDIKQETHLKKQLELFRNFRITENLAFGKHIITELEFKKFASDAENGNNSFWPWLDSNCENGYLSISKPIFNETFDKAFIVIGSISGGKAGGGETRIYQFKNGKWTIEKTEFEWIS